MLAAISVDPTMKMQLKTIPSLAYAALSLAACALAPEHPDTLAESGVEPPADAAAGQAEAGADGAAVTRGGNGETPTADDAGVRMDAAALLPGVAPAAAQAAPTLAASPSAHADSAAPPVESPPVEPAESGSDGTAAVNRDDVSDAGAPAGPAPSLTRPDGSCSVASDCANTCAFVGVVSCCRDDDRCGCTWAPGAYCL